MQNSPTAFDQEYPLYQKIHFITSAHILHGRVKFLVKCGHNILGTSVHKYYLKECDTGASKF